jgi:hypothetical protein
VRAVWLVCRNGARQIRGECTRCGSYLGALPQTPQNIILANQGSHPTPLLTFLLALAEAGVEVRLVAGDLTYTPWQTMTPELWALERQCRGQLHAMMVPEPSATEGCP